MHFEPCTLTAAVSAQHRALAPCFPGRRPLPTAIPTAPRGLGISCWLPGCLQGLSVAPGRSLSCPFLAYPDKMDCVTYGLAPPGWAQWDREDFHVGGGTGSERDRKIHVGFEDEGPRGRAASEARRGRFPPRAPRSRPRQHLASAPVKRSVGA